MADFNLLAEIDVQLAENAAEKLTAGLKKVSLPTKEVKIKAKVTSVGLTELKKQLAEMTSKEYILKITVAKGTAKNIETLNTQMNNLLETITKFGGNLNPAAVVNSLSKLAGKNAQQIKNAALKGDDVQFIRDLEKRLVSLNSKANKGNFIPYLNDQLQSLFNNYNKFKTNYSKISPKNQEKAIKELLENFTGVNGKDPAKNLLRAIDESFNAVAKLDKEATVLRNKGLLDPNSQKALDNAKKSALDLLKTLDAANSGTFRASLDSIISPAISQLRDANNEGQKYRRLLKNIAKEQQDAIQSGAGQNVRDAIEKKRQRAENLRGAGVRVDAIQEDSDFIISSAVAKNIGNAERSAKRLESQLTQAISRTASDQSYGTLGAKAVGLTEQVERVSKTALDRLNALRGNSKDFTQQAVADISSNFRADVGELKNAAKEYDVALKGLYSKRAYYDNNDLQASLKETTNTIRIVQRLASKGISSNTLSKYLLEQNQAIETLANKEGKIVRYTNSINRLRASLEGGLGEGDDRAGVTRTLDNLQKKIQNTPLDSFDDTQLKKTISEETYRARAQARINKAINTAANKFKENAFNTDPDSIVGQGWVKGGEEFDKLVSKIDFGKGSWKDLAKANFEVREAFDLAFGRAQTEAAGGFFGVFSKAAGLAVKRLSAFLIAAQALYAIQNTFASAIRAVGDLDASFIRLEQIFTGSDQLVGSVQANVDRLSSKILTLGKNYGIAAQEIAQSADILAQADIRGPDLDKILEVATKARLGPTFKSNIEITESLIAAMNQFNLTAADSEDIIGGISQVSAQFAVESEGITAAIRRAGGAFSAGRGAGVGYKDALANFIGLFSVLKQETREADETLATSLRNILTRIQRTNVQKFLREKFNIDLLDDDNQFVGPVKALEAVRAKLDELGIQSTDPRFAQIVEKLAGARQTSRLTSLLNGLTDVNKVIREFSKGGEILDRDVGIAFVSIQNKLERAKNAVVELFTVIGRSAAVKALIELFTLMTTVITNLVQSINLLSVALVAIANISTISAGIGKLVKTIKEFAIFGPGLVTSAFLNSRVAGFGKLKEGGIVPGIGPNVDTEPYLLAKGEYVVNKHSVKKYGRGYFDLLNSGKINKAADGTGAGGLLSGSTTSTVNKAVNGLYKLVDAFGRKVADISQRGQSFVTGLNNRFGGGGGGLPPIGIGPEDPTGGSGGDRGKKILASLSLGFSSLFDKFKSFGGFLSKAASALTSMITSVYGLATIFASTGIALTLLATYSKEANESIVLLAKAASSAAVSIFAFAQAQKLVGSFKDPDSIGGKVLGKVLQKFGVSTGAKTLGTAGGLAIPDNPLFNNLGSALLPGTTNRALSAREEYKIASRLDRFSKFINSTSGVPGGTPSSFTGQVLEQGGGSGGILNSLKNVINGLTKFGKAFQITTYAVIGASAALKVFTNASIEAANKALEAATTEFQVRTALRDRRLAESANRGAGIALSTTGAAGVGATVGTLLGGPVGAAIGALGGGIAGLIFGIKDKIAAILRDSTIVTLISNFFSGFTNFFSNISSSIERGVYGFFGGIDNLFEGLKNETQKLQDRNQINNENNLAFSQANIAGFRKSKNNTGISATNQLSRAVTNLNDFIIFDDADRIKGKESAEALKGVLDELGAFQRGAVIDAAKKSGVDLVKMFDKFGVEFSIVESSARQAASELSRIFLEIENVNKKLFNRISSFTTETDIVSQKADVISGNATRVVAPEQLFDAYAKGQRISGSSSQLLNQELGDFRNFSRAGAANLDLNRAASSAIESIIDDFAKNGLQFTGDGGFKELSDILTSKFEASLANADPNTARRASNAFDEFLTNQTSALSELIGGESNDVGKISEALRGFSESIDNGTTDVAKKFSAANNDFKSKLDNIIKKRIEYEARATDILLSNSDKIRAQFDVFNKATGQDPTKNQATFLDERNLGLLLQNTGLGPNASVKQIGGRLAGLKGSDPETQGIRDNLTKALQSIAGGTNEFAFAMQNFDKAVEKAKKSTEEFTGALLGSDEELINNIKGIAAFQSITSSKDSGQAFLRLQGLDESTRSSVSKFISGDEDRQKLFNSKLGIGTDVSATAEAKTVNAEIEKQIEANNILAEVNKNMAAQMDALAVEFRGTKEAFLAIKDFGVQINNFAKQAGDMANKMAEIPKNITHTHTFTVSPIQVSFTGTDNLKNMDENTRTLVTELVNTKISQFAENLKRDNKGLSVTSLATTDASAKAS